MIRNNRLEIFENFEIDQNLPKHNGVGELIASPNQGWILASDGATFSLDSGNVANDSNSFKISKFFKKKKKGRKVKKHKKSVIVKTVGDFFNGVFSSIEELREVEDVVNHYNTIVKNAQTTGQKALIEKVKDMIDLISLESKLITSNFTKYVTEEQIVSFLNIEDVRLKNKNEIQKKYIHLSWIKNYNRIIPDKVVEVKRIADTLNVFDNYVILYYSPEGKHESLTKEEIKKAADPILFGVIESSNKLYYIADWIDEYCNLTLDKLLNTIDEKSFEITNESVKTIIK